MKKLTKLTLNEMQDFVPLEKEEQIALKGGNPISLYQWASAAYLAWKISKEIMEAINSKNTPSTVPYTRVYGPDSVVTKDGTKIYYPDSMYLGSGN